MKYFWLSLALILALGAGSVAWVYNSVSQTGDTSTEVRFVVASGEGVRDVSKRLYEQKYIPSQQAWTLYVLITGRRGTLRAGDYTITHAMSGRQILEILVGNQPEAQEVKITIPEGMTATEIADRLEKAEVTVAASFMLAVNNTDSRAILPDENYDFLTVKPVVANLEGYLFPDTYRFVRHSTAENVLKKFLDNFGRRVDPTIRQQAAASGHTLYEILIMGSILEAELKSNADRALAADLFWRRIKIGMPMQSDATVNYITGKGRMQPSIDDTKAESPYNTYLYTGLPPGPINNPGLSAIKAAITPTPNDYLFYLTAPDGQTIFSKTLEEHNLNKQKYLK